MKNYELNNDYGYYDVITGEYVITRPDTPTPWINYLGAGKLGGIISNTAGGYIFDRDPKYRRITRYRYNSIPADQPGRYIYLRDQESNIFWSPTWQPTPLRQLTTYECRHGPGYTRITSHYEDIRTELLYFVPPTNFKGDNDQIPCELWVMKLHNNSMRLRCIRSFSYIEFGMWNTEIDQNNLDWGQHILHSQCVDGIIYMNSQFRQTNSFFSSSLPPLGFDTDREVFIGSYRDLSNPQVVEKGQPKNSLAARGNNVGVLCHEFILHPGEEKKIIYILGVCDRPEEINPFVKNYIVPRKVDSAFSANKSDWASYLGNLQVETPDPQMNAMLNIWNQVQCRATLFWSRFASAYETGLGRGMGTRDSAQDVLATVHSVPRWAKKTLSVLWKLQFKDGHTWHQVYPLTGEGGVGLAAEHPDWPQWFCDDHLWLLMATCAYLRETGDFSYLDERLPYSDDGEATIWEHMQCAVDFTLKHLGPHGLPRLGFSDWDDTMNLDHGSGKAESVMAAQLFCRVALDISELCKYLKKSDEAEKFKTHQQKMAEIINRVAWDGEWYLRGFDDEGIPVGTIADPYHKIGLNTQTWAVLGECTPRERAEQAMKSAHKWLNTPYGLTILAPAYRKFDPRVCGTTTYPPGAKENGSIFCHTNPWAIIAAIHLGWNELAYQYYRQIMPLNRHDNDIYKVEPYVYCGNVCGPEHPNYGYGRNAWLSGTASWAYVAATQWILGIRPTFSGLCVAPAMPGEWKGFSVRRVFRNVIYNISVERHGTCNEILLSVDGKNIDGTVIPMPSNGTRELNVKAIIK